MLQVQNNVTGTRTCYYVKDTEIHTKLILPPLFLIALTKYLTVVQSSLSQNLYCEAEPSLLFNPCLLTYCNWSTLPWCSCISLGTTLLLKYTTNAASLCPFSRCSQHSLLLRPCLSMISMTNAIHINRLARL